jgi:hypothetical protein
MSAYELNQQKLDHQARLLQEGTISELAEEVLKQPLLPDGEDLVERIKQLAQMPTSAVSIALIHTIQSAQKAAQEGDVETAYDVLIDFLWALGNYLAPLYPELGKMLVENFKSPQEDNRA